MPARRVFTVPRRIFLYWLLLLVPTIGVGGAAILLLQREQARLRERSDYADEARRAAIAARARLIAENVELLVGDVENGLLDILAAEPSPDLDVFLEEWEKTNPLVRTAFRATSGGRMLRPDGRTASEDGRGFLRRFAQRFGSQPPWAVAPLVQQMAPPLKLENALDFDAEAARQTVGRNVAQVQSARRDVQDLIKNSTLNGANSSQMPSAPAGQDERSRPQLAAAAKSAMPRAVEEASKLFSSSGAGSSKVGNRFKDAASAERRGWVPIVADGRLQLLGWVQPGGQGEVRGVEIQVAELVRRLAAALPADVSGGEGYSLRDDQGRVLHQSWAVLRQGEPALRVPLAAALLPGWDVAAYTTAPTTRTADAGNGLIGLGVLLVGIFVAAILAGGSLLLWQARRSEAEAAQKTSFVANVSHEFKTPLTTIRLYAELLEQGRVRDAAQGGEYLRTIGRETQRLARLVNNALDFSRLEQGKKKYAREEIDLVAGIGRLLDIHAPRLTDAGMALCRELPDAPVRVVTDRDALEQIVLNLMDNACKYAADGREVTVRVVAGRNGGAAVHVADRGPGVPPAHRDRIFEKFHRVDDALTAEKTGAGLGLSIARQLARGLGGDLHYLPREGGGAEFVLELPDARSAPI